MARGTSFGSSRSPEKGPCSSYLRGPFHHFRPVRPGEKPVAARPRFADDAGMTAGAIYQHPLAYLLGLEGVALMRAMAGEHEEAFVSARIAEVRELLAEPSHWGEGVTLSPLTAAEAYDAWAPSYDEPNSLSEYEQGVVGPILEALAPGVAVDAACGTGRHARALAARGHEVHGFDVSPGMLDVARSHLPAAHLEVADVSALAMPDGSADLMVNTLALAHVEDLGPVLAEAARVLRPGGHLVISDSRSLFVGSRLYPLVKQTLDGRVGYLPTWRHGVGEYLRAALAHGFEALACAEPVREPLDADDWDPPEVPEPGEPPNPWGLMPVVPQATWATYLGTPALLVWHFRRRA
jgi:SAM-dependent methyltransferase